MMNQTVITLKPIVKVSSGERLMNGVSDQAVVDRVLAGDMDAFSILVDRYQDRIYSAVLNYVYNRDDAVDITQEAFVRAFSKLKTFTAGSAFYTWLYRIAVNAAIDHLRRRKTKPVESIETEKFTEVGFEPPAPEATSNPEKLAVRQEQVRVIKQAISTLSDKLRIAIVLHDVEGLSQEEVADILGVPVGTVKSRVSRARAELRYKLREYAGDLL